MTRRTEKNGEKNKVGMTLTGYKEESAQMTHGTFSCYFSRFSLKQGPILLRQLICKAVSHELRYANLDTQK